MTRQPARKWLRSILTRSPHGTVNAQSEPAHLHVLLHGVPKNTVPFYYYQYTDMKVCAHVTQKTSENKHGTHRGVSQK